MIDSVDIGERISFTGFAGSMLIRGSIRSEG